MRPLRDFRRAAPIAVICVALSVLVLAWWIVFGFGLGYSPSAPIPQAARLVTMDKSSDGDDPISSREAVVDVGSSSSEALAQFYRDAYPSSHGWTEGTFKGPDIVCRVNRSSSRYVQVLDVLPYHGHRVATRQGRYLVVISRIEHIGGGDHPCGYANSWVPSDLL